MKNILMKTKGKVGFFKLISYVLGVLLISFGIVDRFTGVFGGNKAWQGWLGVILISAYIVHWAWFKPPKKHKHFVKRAEGYNEKLHNKGKAIEILNKSLELHDITEGQKIDTYLKLGNLYLEEKDTGRAEACYSIALNMQEDILQKGDMLFQIGGKHYKAKEYVKASEYLDRAFDIGFNHTKKIYINGPTIAQVMDVYIKAGRMNRAEEVYNRLKEKGVVKKNKKVEKILCK